MADVQLSVLTGIDEIRPGDDLVAVLGRALDAMQYQLRSGDILIVAQKIVSKAQGRLVCLNGVKPSARAHELATLTGKDPRLIEVVLSESSEVVRAAPNVLIVRHRLGFVVANAGVDRSNVPSSGPEEWVLLLPEDPDGFAAKLRAGLAGRWGVEIGVVISDSFGRPWRNGVTNVAIGVAGLPSLVDRRGHPDRSGRALEVTQVAVADSIASAAGLLMGEAAEGTPAVLIRGLSFAAPPCDAKSLIRPLDQDLFR